MTSPEELADGLSAEERAALLVFAGLLNQTPDLAASRQLMAKRLLTPEGRLDVTDLGRQVAEELQKQKPDA